MIKRIPDHNLQHMLVEYMIGPALRCEYIGERHGADIFRIECTTGFYELHLGSAANDSENAIKRLDGSSICTLLGQKAMILPTAANSNASFYFYKHASLPQ